MKKIPQIALIVFSLFLLSGNVFAQMTQYTWDEYNMKFNIPENFSIYENNSRIFSAGYENMRVTIFPETGDALKQNEIQGHLSDWACLRGATFSVIKSNPDNSGYWSAYTHGTGENGMPVFVGVYVHPDSPSKYFFIWLDYKESSFNTAEEIITSFQPI